MRSSRRVRPIIAVAATLGFAAIALAPVSASAADGTWYVDQMNGADAAGCGAGAGPDACVTIGAALGQAAAGDTIEIASGTYSESLTFDSPITLTGMSSGVVLTPNLAPAITATASAGGDSPAIDIQGLELLGDGDYPALLIDGADVTLDSAAVSGVGQGTGVHVRRGSVTIDGSELSGHGNAVIVSNTGAAEQDPAELTVRNSLITDNQNGAIVDFHDNSTVLIENSVIENTRTGVGVDSVAATIIDSVIRGNGYGGVVTNGYTFIHNTTIDGNSGAGVRAYAAGQISMTNSTISGTQSHASDVGGLGALGMGVMLDEDSRIDVDSSTIWGNTSQGVLNMGGSFNAMNTTIGGTNAYTGPLDGFPMATIVAPFGGLRLASTIVAGGDGIPACFGTVEDGGYNLATDDLCAFGETSLNSADPQLGDLADNGGPTQTVLPALGPAVDAIPADWPGRVDTAYDQRGAGFARVNGAGSDIGAVEVAQAPIIIAPDSLPAGTVDEEYSVTLSATGGAGAPYDWSLTEPTLPAGLTLSADGIISGIPTEDGTFSITVSIDDGAATKAYSITVAPVDVVPDPPVDPDPVEPDPVDPGPGTGGGSEDAGTLPATGADPSAAVALGALLLLLGGAAFAGARAPRRTRA